MLSCSGETPALAGVTNGQAVNAANTNAAFMDKNTSQTFTTAIASLQGGFETNVANDSTTTGSNQNVTLAAPITAYTNNSLTSIQNITLTNRQNGSIVWIKNATSGTITLKHKSGGTSALQISSCTNSDFPLLSATAIQLYYDTVASKWQINCAAGSDVNAGNISSGTLLVAHGGTGQVSFTANGLLIGNGSSALSQSSVGTTGQILTGATSSAPVFSSTPTLGASGTTGTLTMIGTSGGSILIQPQASAGTYNLNLPTSAGTSGQAMLSGGGSTSPMTFGTLGVAAGGTGQVSLTAHGIVLGNGTSGVGQVSVGATGTMLTGSTTADPVFSATPTLGASGTSGTLTIVGSSSGSILIQPQAAAGTYNWNLPTTAGSSGNYLASGGGSTSPMTWKSFTAHKATFLTSGTSATYSVGSTALALYIECVGQGGGGGGSADASLAAAAGGGGAGGHFVKWITSSVPSSLTYTIGSSGGAGGSAGNNSGTGGSSTTVVNGVTTYTAAGGAGGGGSSGAIVGPAFATGSAAGGSATNGDLNQTGATGRPGLVLAATQALGGEGASSIWGSGGFGGQGTQGGQSCGGYGSGGGGGAGVSAGGSTAGAGGCPSACLILEFNNGN